MFTLRNAIRMRLEEIQEEKKHLWEMIDQLTNEQQELITRLERFEQKGEIKGTSEEDETKVSSDRGSDVLSEKRTGSMKENRKSLSPEYVLPTDPASYSKDGAKSMSYKELTQILVAYAKKHHNQVDHEKFKQYLKDHYHFTPENFSHLVWRARKEDPRLRSLISGNRQVTILESSKENE
ncbi:hypothetical protein MUN89_20740 [Halobacillus salinarum]|uniref:Uncharacterized protein n=1 Tax=Halobacillus salinarum TaxID=2932257 RepID=A0ABY4EIJ8_9BACI|nr:hypothetical protein [Halobacillus salinarum]UOQ44250.1 hypothetical protein MUN89_20740 [Halobacillus salinarum]